MRPPAVLAIHGGGGPGAGGAPRGRAPPGPPRGRGGPGPPARPGPPPPRGPPPPPPVGGGGPPGGRPGGGGRPGAAPPPPGGRPAQLPGGIGDSPIPGAGTWADDATCAVSATGIGEAFLRAAFAHEVDARLRLLGSGLDAACRAALAEVAAAGGDGG